MYQVHPPHRNGSPQKSQWTIPEEDETACFDAATAMNWLVGDAGWGLHIVNTSPTWLGTCIDGTRSFVAKFVGNVSTNVWHGYPADHRKPQDVPADEVLRAWLAQGRLGKAKIRKLAKGQPCRL